MDELKDLATNGICLKKVVEQAKEHGNNDFAKLVETCIDNLQACYDVVSQKWTSTAGEELWNIDAEYLKTFLK